MSMRTAAAAAACTGLAVMGVASPALAGGNGATVINQHGCQDYSGVTVCSTEHVEDNMTVTPSGNTSFEDNWRHDYTVTFPSGFSYSESGFVHTHSLFKPGELQEYMDHFSDTQAVSGYGSCTSSVDLHYANGQWQFVNFDYVCTP